MPGDLADRVEEQVLVHRSYLDDRVWVAVPYGIFADQMYARFPGPLRRVQDFAIREFSEPGVKYRWVRRDRDTYVMTAVVPA